MKYQAIFGLKGTKYQAIFGLKGTKYQAIFGLKGTRNMLNFFGGALWADRKLGKKLAVSVLLEIYLTTKET